MPAAPPSLDAASIDHVAVAVRDLDAAQRRWTDVMGGRLVMHTEQPDFHARQLRFAGGGKLELLAPAVAGAGFVAAFLDRFGVRVHHVTIKVPDLAAALDVVAQRSLDPIDVDLSDPSWREAFLRPSQAGGIVVQLAETDVDDDDWARLLDLGSTDPPPDAAVLHGPLLGHPDLDAAARLWSVLGAHVERDGTRMLATWGSDPLSVVVTEAEVPGPVALRCTAPGRLLGGPDDPSLTDHAVGAGDAGGAS